MRRPILSAVILALSWLPVQAQVTGVSTTAQNKVAIMEEFTGVRCTFCPDGHTVLLGIDAAYPGQFYAVSFHPSNSSLTAPYTGDPDLRRTYPEPFYSTPYCGSSRFMPSAFINRRIWSAERLQGRGTWDAHVQEIIAEPSPANVGLLASYDSLTSTLSVTVEVYYTSTVTNANNVYVVLSEDDLTVQQQAGASGAYVQDRVFREAMSAQWGDAVTQGTTSGSLATFTYTFNNGSTGYDMSACRVTAYVEDQTTGELYSGMQKFVTIGTAVATDDAKQFGFGIAPNPFHGATKLTFGLDAEEEVELTVMGLDGKMLVHKELGMLPAGEHVQTIDAAQEGLAQGMYILHLRAGNATAIQRMVVE